MVKPRARCLSRIWEEFWIMATTVNQGSGEQGLSQALGPPSFGFFQRFLPLWNHEAGSGGCFETPSSYPSVMLPRQECSLPTSFSPAHFFVVIFCFYCILEYGWGFPGDSRGKESAYNAGDAGDQGSIPGWGTSPGGGHGSPLQYSCLENPVDRGAWWGTVQRVPKSWTQLKQVSMLQG